MRRVQQTGRTHSPRKSPKEPQPGCGSSVRTASELGNDYRDQRGTESSSGKVCLRKSVDRKPALLVTAEVNGGGRASIDERDGGESDQSTMTVVDEPNLHLAYGPAHAHRTTRIGN